MIILDTDVISEFSRPYPDVGVADWMNSLAPSDPYITAITEAELRYGVSLLPDGRRRERLLARIERTLRRYFVRRILPFDSNAARSYAALAADRRARGRPISHPDCQIAAIAHSVGAALATRNVTDFKDCGIEVINPWSNP